MIVLGIETSCDETSAAIVRDGKHILSNVTASSADLHERYGGVFPELACRRHIEVLFPVIHEACKQAGVTSQDIDLIAVTQGPGLVGALLIGISAAKGLAIAWKKPLVGVNHVEAHLYAAMMGLEGCPLPGLGLVLSGGHTLLLQILGLGSYRLLGTTVDDAIGEAFDKVGTLLGLPYPGGPKVEQLALSGNPKGYAFKAGNVKKSPLDFSFSGLKTSVLYAVRDKKLSENQRADVAASFQQAAFFDVVKKASLAPQGKALFFGGGVCNNRRLRTMFAEQFPNIPLFWPPVFSGHDLSLDNAAMIAGLGYHKFLANGRGDALDFEAQPRTNKIIFA